MRKHWQIPPERFFTYTGPDWLQNLLMNLNQTEGSRTLMLLWRAWHLRNDIIHGNGKETIARSAAFLIGYDKFLQDPNNDQNCVTGLTQPLFPLDSNINGSIDLPNRKVNKASSSWSPPNTNELKMNVDAAFCPESSEAAAGIAVRNHLGEIIAAASIVLDKCRDAEEAEATAIWAGLKFAVHHNLKPSVLESDNAVAVAAINSPLPNNSANWHVYSNIKRLRDVLPGCAIFRIGRKGNGVAHDLARMARRSGVSNAWLNPIPTVISDLCKQDSVSFQT
jgi:ribonuclease HI